MEASTKIKLRLDQKTFQIWNPNSILPVENKSVAIVILKNFINMLHTDFRCTEIDGEVCELTQYEVKQLLYVKAMQVVRISDCKPNPFEQFSRLFIKTEGEEIQYLKRHINNYGLFYANCVINLPQEISFRIANLLEIHSFVKLAATCSVIRNLLSTPDFKLKNILACEIAENYRRLKKEQEIESNHHFEIINR